MISLIEALGSTDLNLLVDVGFNQEVAKDTALYWNRSQGSLAQLINKVDNIEKDPLCMIEIRKIVFLWSMVI